MKPHKHAELIKAWADGAEIQYKSDLITEWSDIKSPKWELDHEYRIKQQDLSSTYIADHKYNVRVPEHWETPNLLLRFDGQTGQLKSAEVI